MKMKVGVIIVLTIILGGFLFAGGSQDSGDADVVEIVFTTPSVPGEEHTKSLKVVQKYIEDNADGRMTFTYHDSGSLFSQDAELPATIKGNVSMCYTDSSWLGDYMSSIKMFSAGYIFTGPDHMDKVLNGAIGEKLFAQVADEVGVRPLSAYYMGSRTINLRQEEPAMTLPLIWLESNFVCRILKHGFFLERLLVPILFLSTGVNSTHRFRQVL